MPKYIAFVNWTDQGIKHVKDTVERAHSADELAKKYGSGQDGLQLYWTAGPYDLIAIFDAHDDKSATAFILEVGAAGNVRTTMMRAYNRGEMSEIIKKLD